MTKHSHKSNENAAHESVEAAQEEAVNPESVFSESAVEGEAPPAEPPGETVAAPDPVAALEEAVAALTTERDTLQNQLLRARAEFDNYRKRMMRQTEQIRKTAAEDLLRGLLPVVDNLERALNHAEGPEDGLAQGLRMILQQLCEVLKGQGLTPIPALGEPFDPHVHEAMSHLPSDEYPSGAVLAEYERGYRIGDYILRPAKVVVSSGPAGAAEESAEEEMECNGKSEPS